MRNQEILYLMNYQRYKQKDQFYHYVIFFFIYQPILKKSTNDHKNYNLQELLIL